MEQATKFALAPNVFIVESAGNLRRAACRRRVQGGAPWHSVARTPLQVADDTATLAETLRSRGYYTAQAACHLLDKEDELPTVARGFVQVYSVFFSVDMALETGAEFSSRAARVRDLNDDVIDQALCWIADSAQRRQPFYVVCAVETAAGQVGYDPQFDRLRHALRELGIEQDTLLVHQAGVAVQVLPRAA